MQKQTMRIVIEGIEADLDISSKDVANALNAFGLYVAKPSQVEVTYPDPPDILEKEFGAVDDAFSILAQVVSDSEDYYGEGVTTPAEARKALRAAQMDSGAIEDAYDDLLAAVAKLKAAVTKLPKK